MLRRPAAIALGVLALLASAAPAWAHVELEVANPNASTTTTTEATTTTESTTTTDADLPGTTLEAEERDDGNTSAAPWLIGSGIAALVAIGVGGTILKRRAG